MKNRIETLITEYFRDEWRRKMETGAKKLDVGKIKISIAQKIMLLVFISSMITVVVSELSILPKVTSLYRDSICDNMKNLVSIRLRSQYYIVILTFIIETFGKSEYRKNLSYIIVRTKSTGKTVFLQLCIRNNEMNIKMFFKTLHYFLKCGLFEFQFSVNP